jgi:diamine N-acetyltransferase
MPVSVTLRDITRQNWRECVNLKVRPDQQHFVATNAGSMAQARYEPEWIPLAVYDGATMVGFVMYGIALDDRQHWILRVMVDAAHQGKGYGRALMRALLARMRDDPACDEIFIGYEPDNAVAEALYQSLGFEQTGQIVEGEVVARLSVRRREPS